MNMIKLGYKDKYRNKPKNNICDLIYEKEPLRQKLYLKKTSET